MKLRILLPVILCCASASPQSDLPLPADYRDWMFLSSGLGMNYSPAAGAGPENPPFQNVFVSRAGYQGFLKAGIWPDGTTFVLEIRASESRGSINRSGHYQGAISAIEAEVKEKGQWTFYGFGKDGKIGKAFARTERCYSCHAENGAVDNTFVQFYPTLMPVARAKGTFRITAEGK
jgi:hypothetical protein